MKARTQPSSASGRRHCSPWGWKLIRCVLLGCGLLPLWGPAGWPHSSVPTAPEERPTVASNPVAATADPSVAQALPVVPRPPAEQPPVGLPEDTRLGTAPPRATKGLDLVKLRWTYNCMECHKLLPARWHYDRPMMEHKDIRLEHGNNRFCLNCHHPTNRNAFVDYDGSEIAEADVVQLCAKCHGTIYRDWQAGVHGRHNGYWDVRRGPRTKLRCIQCHDPHRPAFAPMTPMPPLRYPPRAARPHPSGMHKPPH